MNDEQRESNAYEIRKTNDPKSCVVRLKLLKLIWQPSIDRNCRPTHDNGHEKLNGNHNRIVKSLDEEHWLINSIQFRATIQNSVVIVDGVLHLIFQFLFSFPFQIHQQIFENFEVTRQIDAQNEEQTGHDVYETDGKDDELTVD